MLFSTVFAREFSSVEQEKTFLEEYGRKFVSQRRLAAALALAIWSAFFLWDWVQSHTFTRTVFLYLITIRIVGIIFFSWLLKISWKERFIEEKYATQWLVTAVLFGWNSLLIMMIIAPPNNTFREYYPGLLLAYYFLFTFLRIRTKQAAIVGTICFVTFNIAEYQLNRDPSYLNGMGAYAWFSSAFFLICFSVLGSIVATQLEVSSRADFTARRALIKAQAEATAATMLLKKQNDKMQELALEKERFFSSAYHDIQQPLAVIGLYVRSAVQKLQNHDPTIRSDLALIEDSTVDMVNLFKGIHDYSELGSYKVQLQAVDPAEVLHEVMQQYGPVAKEKGIAFKLSGRDRPPAHINTDRPLFKRLLANLISNAIKYTFKGGVVIGWVALPNTLRIDVWDTGIGIPEEHREKIFSEYYQVNNPGRDRSRGIGLGLSIVHKIEEILPRHRIRFSSVEGRGSRFSLYAPVVAGRIADAPSMRDGGGVPSDLSGKYIVVCDDEPALLRGLAQLFTSAGALVDSVGSLTETRGLLETIGREPDVIVTDMRLQGGDTGIQVAQAIRSYWEVSTPVAFITGELITSDSQSMNGFQPPFTIIRKSSDPEQIVSQVQGLLNADGQQRGLES
ncbi:hybrid sensor histidine kinase/response regulator [Paraburkholderia strydomiana]